MRLRGKYFLKVDIRSFSICNQRISPGRWKDFQDILNLYLEFLHSTIMIFYHTFSCWCLANAVKNHPLREQLQVGKLQGIRWDRWQFNTFLGLLGGSSATRRRATLPHGAGLAVCQEMWSKSIILCRGILSQKWWVRWCLGLWRITTRSCTKWKWNTGFPKSLPNFDF